MNRYVRYLVLICLSAVLLVPLLAACRPQQPPAPAGIDLSKTLVPNLALDAYVYIKQDNPTKIPRGLVGSSSDVAVESLAIWGLAKDTGFATGGALTFAAAADAARIQGQIPAQAGVWASVTDRTIYFVQGSGPTEETLKSAITKKDFVYYQDQQALAETALFPNGGNTKPAAVIVIKPNQQMVKLVAGYDGQQTTDLLNAMMSFGQLQTVVAALYSPAQLDVSDLMHRLSTRAVWETRLGVLASAKSGLAAPLIGPLVSSFLPNAGYAATTSGDLSLYKGSLNVAGKVVPILISVEGNRIYLAVSAQESYAQTLLSSVKR